MASVLIVEDHPMFCEAVQSAVQLALPGATIREASAIEDLLEERPGRRKLRSHFARSHASRRVRLRRLSSHPVQISSIPNSLIFSALNDPKIAAQAIRMGAAGLCQNRPAEIFGGGHKGDPCGQHLYTQGYGSRSSGAARREKANERHRKPRFGELTQAQSRLLQLIRQGLLNKQIAHELGVGETTVKAHVSEILRKLNV